MDVTFETPSVQWSDADAGPQRGAEAAHHEQEAAAADQEDPHELDGGARVRVALREVSGALSVLESVWV